VSQFEFAGTRQGLDAAAFQAEMAGMSTPVLTGENAEEYKRLTAEYPVAEANATAALKSHGMDSEEFKRADAAKGAIWRRLRELQGMGGKHWMA
jgi:hypothetical protein